MQPSLLERFPTVDRVKAAFPTELVGFFLDNDEKALTAKEVDTIKQNWLHTFHQEPDSFCQQEVCTGIDGTIIYITAHIFFEDLSDIQTTLPEESVMNELHKIVEVRESNKEESSSSDDPQELETSFEHLEYR